MHIYWPRANTGTSRTRPLDKDARTAVVRVFIKWQRGGDAGTVDLHDAAVHAAKSRRLAAMDAAAVEQRVPLLSAEDARLVAELERPPPPPQVALWQGAVCYSCGQPATRTIPNQQPNRNDRYAHQGHSGICAQQACWDKQVT